MAAKALIAEMERSGRVRARASDRPRASGARDLAPKSVRDLSSLTEHIAQLCELRASPKVLDCTPDVVAVESANRGNRQ